MWFFCCISDDWQSMLGRVYPNEECIVEDIDDCGAFNWFNVRLRDVEENLTIANMFENILVGDSFVDELD